MGSRKKETLADGIARIRASDPEHANDADWIAAMLTANHSAVKEQLSQIHRRELAQEIGNLPETFELRAIADALVNMEITTQQVLQKLGKLVTRGKIPDRNDVKNFALIGKHMLAVLGKKLEVIALQNRIPIDASNSHARSVVRTSNMKPQIRGH